MRIHPFGDILQRGISWSSDNVEFVGDSGSADGWLVRGTQLYGMKFPQKLIAIASAGASEGSIPLNLCTQKGIVVFNMPGEDANAVKELVICGLLLASRDIIDGAIWCRENAADIDISKAAENAKKKFAGNEIAGKKLGVIGLGPIGSLVANAAVGLGMDVCGFDPQLSVNDAWVISNSVSRAMSLDDICRECDYIAIQVSATETAGGMIGEHEIGLMKPGAVLLNFSHDMLVDNDVLASALHDGRIRRYVTDFANPVIMGQKNAIVLPHLGALTVEAKERRIAAAVSQMVDYFENGNIGNSVNYPDCVLGPLRPDGQRICIMHKYTPNAVNELLEALSLHSFDIAELVSKTQNGYTYTMIDIDENRGKIAENSISADDRIIRIRVLG